MTNAQTGTLVLKDSTGSYFLVPRETLEQGRVAEEQKADLERLTAMDSDGDALQGYITRLTSVDAHTAQDDVRGNAIMIGGIWFDTPGDESNPRPPMHTHTGVGNPPRLPRQPKIS